MNSGIRKVFVTGASGFIGSHLVDRLVAGQYEVTVLLRPGSDLRFLPVDKIKICYGDIRDSAGVTEAMSGCDAVFHVAALASDWGRKKDFHEINVQGTRNVVRAAKEQRVKKVVLVSSIAVLGEEDEEKPKPEEAPYRPDMPYFLSAIFPSDMNYYRETKMLAEQEAVGIAGEGDLNLVVIRPVWVYGPREFHSGPYEFCRAVLQGMRVMPMGRTNRFHVIHVKDLVRGMLLALEKDLSGVHVFNMGNDRAPNIREYFNLYCRNLGIRPPVYLPLWVFYPSAVFLELMAKLLGAKEPFLLTRARVKMFYCHNVYATARAGDVLGFKQTVSLEQGVAETVRWWRQNGFLPIPYDRQRPLQQQFVVGFGRILLDVTMGLTIFLRYFVRLLKGAITLKQYAFFVKRMLLLSKVLGYNKAVKINNVYKIHLYLPAFPSRAFYKAIDKFLITDDATYPTTVVFSMTKACGYHCRHCYQKRDAGEDLPEADLLRLARDIQHAGISMFDIEGGEPLLKYERLLKLIGSLDSEREVWVNTTGHTLTYEKAWRLRQAGLFGVMVSLHHWEAEKHDEFVGFEGAFRIACKAIRIFADTGVTAVINCCPSREMIMDDGIKKILQLGRELGCSFVQVIHEKPAGGWLRRGNTLMDRELIARLCADHWRLNKARELRDFPSLSMQVFESSPEAFGCTAGGIERFYVNAHGEIQPCEFLNVSCGNVQEEPFSVIFDRMRAHFKKPCLSWLCNSEHGRIRRYIEEKKITAFPVTGEDALQLMEQFQNKEEVPLYKKMRLIEKV